MTHTRCNRFLICLTLLSSSAVFSQVYLLNAPRFAEAGGDLSIQAIVEDTPKNVTLNWTAGTGEDQVAMTADADGTRWTGTIPAQAVEGTDLTYTVTAAYDDESQAASPDCTVFICPQYSLLELQPLTLQQTVLVQHEWNSDEAALGLLSSTDGPPLGPAAIASQKGVIYVLDSVNSRVLGFTLEGEVCTTIPLSTSNASDLVIDPADDAVIVVSQLEDKVYEFQDGQLNEARSVAMREHFEYPAKFSYDRHSKNLYARNQNHRERLAAAPDPTADADPNEQPQNLPVLTEAKGQNLFLKTDNGSEIFVITFDQPVGSIDETVTDENGIVWVLYTLDGDYRSRRLARIDTLNAHIETTQINVWFSFDATRRMTVTDTGVALLTGDASHGRIVTFDYAGDLQ